MIFNVKNTCNIFILFSNISIILKNIFVEHWLSLLTKIIAIFFNFRTMVNIHVIFKKNLIRYITIVNKLEAKHSWNKFIYLFTFGMQQHLTFQYFSSNQTCTFFILPCLDPIYNHLHLFIATLLHYKVFLTH